MKAFLGLLVLGLSGLLVSAEDDKAVLTYTKEEFAPAVAKTSHFVMFYAPWCGHCKRLHPAWEDLAEKFNKKDGDKDVLIANIDCTVETALCSEHGVSGYPTLKFFKAGSDEEPEKYRQARDLPALVKYVNQKIGVEEEDVVEEAVAQPEAAVAEKGLYALNDKSFESHIKEGDTFVKFYAPWCGHCKKLAPAWEELAAAFESNKKVSIAKVDCTQAQSLCQTYEVKGYPTLAYFRNGKKTENYRGARSFNDLKEFVTSMTEEKAKDNQEKDKVPEADEVVSQVAVLNTENFDDGIGKGVTFVKFYAPWCGHCKKLSPVWDDLAGKFSGNDQVTIAKIDCTSDNNKNKKLCNEHGVNGFPTLILFNNGKKVEEYSGQRDAASLTAFVQKNASGKDEL